ncbi:hypothetical protein [Usitatibacter palustris]|uniref:Uncharacterized protein n=1 Tax=Usitatibacter palustris TaxID=2732487 RepID=A0A6M4H5D9_9PROT|nr:hypothetical protein [Usitatibacter palustris]QJR14879.1 hypothetical protein DSM104440_01694 [Usitatibacter palustris]
MAEFSIIVVPTDRNFVPKPDAIAAAKSLMESFYPDAENDADVETPPTPRLFTARDGFDSLVCPKCEEGTSQWDMEEDEDGENWWTIFEETMRDSKDPSAEVLEMPCCGASVKAGDLDFGGEAAFARIKFRIRNPGDDPSLSAEHAKALGAALGCEVLGIVEVRS